MAYDAEDRAIIAEAKRRIAANPDDEDARSILEDVANGVSESFAWLTIHPKRTPEMDAEEDRANKEYRENALRKGVSQ
jgi:hypothetical protein